MDDAELDEAEVLRRQLERRGTGIQVARIYRTDDDAGEGAAWRLLVADRDDRPDFALHLPDLLEVFLPKYRVIGEARPALEDTQYLETRVIEVRLRRLTPA